MTREELRQQYITARDNKDSLEMARIKAKAYSLGYIKPKETIILTNYDYRKPTAQELFKESVAESLS